MHSLGDLHHTRREMHCRLKLLQSATSARNASAMPRLFPVTQGRAHPAASAGRSAKRAAAPKPSAGWVRHAALAIVVALSPAVAAAPAPASKPSVYQTTLEERDQETPEVSTEQLQLTLAKNAAIVLDARPKDQYAIAHIPGSINLEEKGVIRFIQSYPDRSAGIIVYSSGPYCDWARQRAAELVSLGYTKVSRYQLGLSVWRALGQTAETSAHGLRHIFGNENNAVIVDARNRAEYVAGTIPGAESILAGEGREAARDRRLGFYDYNARIVVFSNNAENARVVAEELARNSYSNSSYVSATYDDLKRAKFFTPRKPSPSYLENLRRRP